MSTAKKHDLVFIEKGKPFTNSLIITDNCPNEKKGVEVKREHKETLSLIKKYKNEFEELGPFAFKTRKGCALSQGGFAKSTEYCELNEDQATFLITLFRNTKKVVEFKLRLVKEFRRVINEINRIKFEPGRKEAIQHKRDAHTPMMEMLKFTREGLDKETGVKDFSNENRFCNRALTGLWAPCDESKFDVYDARLMEAIRNHNTLLISRYPTQKPERKRLLDQFVTEYRIKHPRFKLVGEK